MSRSVPRSLAVLLCVLPFMVPAMMAGGAFSLSNYIVDGSNNVNHRNTNVYKTFIPAFSNLGNLHDKINAARLDWHGKLASSSVTVPIDNGSSPSATTQIVFGLIDEDINAKLVLTNPNHQRATASFNRWGGKLTNMSGPDRQARACRAIGQMLGVQPKATLTDCMDQDSVATPTVGNASIQKVKDFYDPVASVGGSILQAMPSLHRNSTYGVQTSAIGHDLTKLRLTVRTLQQLNGGSVPDQIYEFSSCTNSNGRCKIDFNFTYNSSTTEPGKYQFIVSAYNAYGDVDTDAITFYVDFPYFGFNDGWTGPAMLGRTPSDISHNPYYGAKQLGANAARMDVIQSTYVNCSNGNVVPANPNSSEQQAYDRFVADGIRPILVLYPDCNPARNYDPSQGGCKQVDFTGIRSVVVPPRNTPADDATWQTAAMTVAARYPDALGIEIGNEVNTTAFWGGCSPDIVRYYELLGLAHAGINSSGGHPSTPVITAGLAPGESRIEQYNEPGQPPLDYYSRIDWQIYLAYLSAFGTSGISDVVGLHPYRTNAECGPQSPTPRTVGKSALAQITKAKNRGASGWPGLPAPVWVTEVGVSTTGNSESDCRRETFANQADSLESLHSAMRDANIPVAVFHSYRDYAAYTTEGASTALWETGTGLVTASGGALPVFSLKPSYCRMMNLRGFARTPC